MTAGRQYDQTETGIRIHERCSCGANTEIETQNVQLAERLIRRWRRSHYHLADYYIPKPIRFKDDTYTPTVTSTGVTYTSTTGTSASGTFSGGTASRATQTGITQQHRGQSPAVRRKTGEENGN
jgi:hypothetical protein